MKKIIFILVCFGLMTLLPELGVDRYYIRFFTYLFMWVALASCWNLSSGYTGYIDFGPVVYFGIGAYSTAILMTLFHVKFFIAVGTSGFLAILLSVFIGIPTLKLKGAYFAIGTFAFAESMKQLILSFDRTFNINFFMGSHGITLPICSDYNLFYYSMLTTAMLIIFAVFLIENSKIGLALKAIKESEEASEMIGINSARTKLSIYMLSAFFIGITGGIYSFWVTYITPDDVFNIHKTVQMVIMTLLGGMGTIMGPILGAVFLTAISEYFGAEFVENYLIIVGSIIIAVILIEPSGLYGLKKWKKFLK